MVNMRLLMAIMLSLIFCPMAGADIVPPAASPPPPSMEGSPPESDSSPPEEEGQDEETVLPGLEDVDAAQRYLSGNVEALSRQIDSFFGTYRFYQESSGTYVQIRGSTIYRRSEGFDFGSGFRVRLDLPNLKEKLALALESDPDQSVVDSRNTEGQPKVSEALDQRGTAAFLQIMAKEHDRWHVRLQPGLRLHMPPETFLRLRVKYLQELGESWLAHLTLTPGWFSDRGWEVRGQVDLERETGGGGLLRATTESVCSVDEWRYPVDLFQGFSFIQPLRHRTVIVYTLGGTAETQPQFEMTSYFANVRYRRNIHRGWVFLEIKPQVGFYREDDFEADPSIALTLELLFGARKY